MQLTEVTNTVNQLANAWGDFKIVNDRRLQDLERKGHTNILDDEHINRLNNSIDECKNRINTIENSSYRPTLDQYSSEQQNFFRDYIRKGTDKPFLERKSLSKDEGDPSGVPLTQATYDQIMIHLKNNSTMRQIASVDTISSDYITFFKPEKEIAVSCGESITNEDLPKVNPEHIHTHILHSCPTITRKLLDDSAIDIDQWIMNNLSEAFSTAENKAFFNGSGNNQPYGMLLSTDIKSVNSASATLSEDGIILLYYTIGEEYANNASFVMHRSTTHHIRSLKSNKTGQCIWQPGLQGSPDTLMGAPVYQSPEMPEISSGNKVIAFGDFNRGYKIIDRSGVNILRDPFSYKPSRG